MGEKAAQSNQPTEASRLGAYYIRGCLQGALHKGYDPREIITQAGLDPAIYDDDDATINGEELQRLVVTTRDVLNDTYLGFMDVQGKLRMSYLAFSSAIKCESFGEALHQLVIFVNAVRNDIRIGYETDRDNDELVLKLHTSGFSEGINPHLAYWFETYWFYKGLCWLVGQRLALKRICFQGEKAPEEVDYGLLFDCPITYNQDQGAMYLPLDTLKLPVIRTEVELREGGMTREYPDWFEIPGQEQSLTHKVEQLLMDLYQEGGNTPTLQVLADILCASPRTVSRHLHKENATFQDIKDKVRRQLAERLLTTTELPVSQIAERVGFWEPADFTRAYVRWTGETPSDFRARRCS